MKEWTKEHLLWQKDAGQRSVCFVLWVGWGFGATVVGMVALLLMMGPMDSFGRLFIDHCELATGETTTILSG